MQVILKPTTACNGSCRYCAAASPGGGQGMDAERLGPLFEAFAPWLAASPREHLTFIWHGGEPMLPGLAYYQHAEREQARVFGADRARVVNVMQSNLGLLDDEWIAFLKGFLRSLGTSYDPLPGIRAFKDGTPLAERWLEALAACRRAGLPVGIVYVVHAAALERGADLYRFFRNLGNGGRVRFNPLYAEGDAKGCEDLAITPEAYGAFLVEVARAWWADGRRAAVLPLTEWHDAWVGRSKRLSCDSRGDCQEHHLGIGPEGDVYGCGRFGDAADEPWRFGNIFSDDLATLLAHPSRTRLSARSGRLRTGACAGCVGWAVCHGGCPMMARIYRGDALAETWFCESRKAVFAFFEERLGPPRLETAVTP